MAKKTINGIDYKLPNSHIKFKEEMYEHLIKYKWKYITKIPGIHAGQEYDIRLPQYPHLYSPIVSDLNKLKKKFPFKEHIHFYHMASSQAANINLFAPLLLSSEVNSVFKMLKDDFDRIATDKLYKGFCFEYWDNTSSKGLLADHSTWAGTDSDTAIAYYNCNNELCLWLIEHKLTEPEFTTCGGFKSIGNKNKENCENSFSDILNDKSLCYYHEKCHYHYWLLTEKHKSFFVSASSCETCPFKGGMNQLWRNQLLGLALEDENKYKHVYFSVVHHPDNHALDKTMKEYKHIINNNPKFSSFASKYIIDKAQSVHSPDIDKWIEWYKELYKIL